MSIKFEPIATNEQKLHVLCYFVHNIPGNTEIYIQMCHYGRKIFYLELKRSCTVYIFVMDDYFVINIILF